jgi:diadenosine tetraphosphatase ApaH/serine/threonine PP2A family protein phosphatase
MRVLVISDIHANLTAFEAVLKAAGPVDSVWCLGDLIGYGPDPNECIERVRTLPNLICLMGNHDAAALNHIPLDTFNREARLSIQWIQGILKAENRDFLATLSEREVIDQVTLTHGSPRNPVWEYLLDTNTAAENFSYFDTQLCFVGHTHLPILYLSHPETNRLERRLLQDGDCLQITERAILNPGSSGQPRDHDPRAAFALFDPQSSTWEAHRVEYDIPSVQKRILAAGLPYRHAQRLSEGW